MFDDVSGLTEKILCNIAEPVVLFNENFQIQWINPAAEMFFEHSTEFMFGKSCSFLFPSLTHCSNKCPVLKSRDSDRIEYLVTEGINQPMRFIESIPFKKNNKKFILALIHNVPDIDKNRAIRRDFAAELNNHKTLKSAIEVISSSILALPSISVFGFYIKNNDIFELYYGNNIPKFLPSQVSRKININKPLYLSAHNQTFISDSNFPDSLALIPIVKPDNITSTLLFVGSEIFTANTQNLLEMFASVLGKCIDRFI